LSKVEQFQAIGGLSDMTNKFTKKRELDRVINEEFSHAGMDQFL